MDVTGAGRSRTATTHSNKLSNGIRAVCCNHHRQISGWSSCNNNQYFRVRICYDTSPDPSCACLLASAVPRLKHDPFVLWHSNLESSGGEERTRKWLQKLNQLTTSPAAKGYVGQLTTVVNLLNRKAPDQAKVGHQLTVGYRLEELE